MTKAKPATQRFIVEAKPSAIKGGKVWEVFDVQKGYAVETWAHKASAIALCRRLNAETKP